MNYEGFERDMQEFSIELNKINEEINVWSHVDLAARLLNLFIPVINNMYRMVAQIADEVEKQK